jgi:hypothetical protein
MIIRQDTRYCILKDHTLTPQTTRERERTRRGQRVERRALLKPLGVASANLRLCAAQSADCTPTARLSYPPLGLAAENFQTRPR